MILGGGDKAGVDAQFTPPIEKLAFNLEEAVEDIHGYWSVPAPSVLRTLTQYESVSMAREHLPHDVV